MENQILSALRKYKRGLFIVFEGLDKSGKTTQTKILAQKLNAKIISFPDRKTQLGQMISDYLQNKKEMRDEVIHLLFSANRWEKHDQILEALNKGTNIISDRYAYSGVAFSAAKGLPIQWCKDSDQGLLKPDFTFYLKAPIAQLSLRDDFGLERYENQVFQNKVGEIFDEISQQNQFSTINALQDKQVMSNEILSIIMNKLNVTGLEQIDYLWGRS